MFEKIYIFKLQFTILGNFVGFTSDIFLYLDSLLNMHMKPPEKYKCIAVCYFTYFPKPFIHFSICTEVRIKKELVTTQLTISPVLPL